MGDSRTQKQIGTVSDTKDLGDIILGKKAGTGEYLPIPLNATGDAVLTETTTSASIVGLENVAGSQINPATEEKQDDIIAAIGAIPPGGADPVGLKTTAGVGINPATSDKQLPDNHQVTVSNMIPAVETGLATSAKQLPDGHNVAVSNFPADFPLPASQVTTLTPPPAITGYATDTKQSDGTQKTQVVSSTGTAGSVTTRGSKGAIAVEVLDAAGNQITTFGADPVGIKNASAVQINPSTAERQDTNTATIQDLYNQLAFMLDRLEYGTQTNNAKRLNLGTVDLITTITSITGFGASASVGVSDLLKVAGVPASRQTEAMYDTAYNTGILANISF